jgi:hypothetical protein
MLLQAHLTEDRSVRNIADIRLRTAVHDVTNDFRGRLLLRAVGLPGKLPPQPADHHRHDGVQFRPGDVTGSRDQVYLGVGASGEDKCVGLVDARLLFAGRPRGYHRHTPRLGWERAPMAAGSAGNR